MRDAMSVPEAARDLRLHRSRIHALLRSGAIEGRKVGGRWLVKGSSVEHWRRSRLDDGRPFSPKRAWGYLFLLSGEPVSWLDPATKSRLRQRIRSQPVRLVLPKLRNRARAFFFRAATARLGEIGALPGFVRSGVSAADEVGSDLVVRDALEGYLPEPRLRDIAYRLALEVADPSAANVILRSPMFVALLRQRVVAPRGVVAVDLIESPDGRTSRAGEMLAESLRADRAASG